MKLCHFCKKYFISIIFLFGLFFIPAYFSRAQTASDVQNKINQSNSNIQTLEQEISSYQTQLDTLGKQKSSLSSSLKTLDLTSKELDTNIVITEKKIDETNLTIEDLNSNIGTKENSIDIDLNSIASGIKSTDEFERTSMLENFLLGNDFTSVWNDVDNMMTVREKIRQNVVDLKQTKNTLENTKQQTITAKNELVALESQLSDQKKIVNQNINEKNLLLKQTKNNENSYQILLKDRLAKRDAFTKELEDYESQLQFILDPSKLPQTRVLSWPLEKVYVTQLFGKTVDSKRLYVSGTHDGVDFRASVGTPVMAMADGTVLGTGNTDLTCPGASFGKFVFIKYNNGLSSTFGHLSLIKSNVGDIVKKGDVVGYSGSTGYVTGPHLHVSLYASQAVKMASRPSAACGGRIYTMPISPVNAYLNVLDYLPPYTINTTILNNQPD